MTQDSWQILFQLLEVSQQGTQALQLPGESVKCMQPAPGQGFRKRLALQIQFSLYILISLEQMLSASN